MDIEITVKFDNPDGSAVDEPRVIFDAAALQVAKKINRRAVTDGQYDGLVFSGDNKHIGTWHIKRTGATA